jgi:aspartokinase-like uncharacterized kinase
VLTVVKVGGGLARALDDETLVALCRSISELAADHPLLVVPGGGGFADAVREHDRRFGLRARTAHAMAILAMDQLGLLLGDLIPHATLSADLDRARRDAARGRPAIVLPAALLERADPLPHSWRVTSDSIAAWLAGASGATRLVLVKPVDGLFLDWPAQGSPLARLTIAELAALQEAGRAGGVDAHLPAALTAAGVDAWVIGGRDPDRLAVLLRDGRTLGTRVAAVPAAPV